MIKITGPESELISMNEPKNDKEIEEEGEENNVSDEIKQNI